MSRYWSRIWHHKTHQLFLKFVLGNMIHMLIDEAISLKSLFLGDCAYINTVSFEIVHGFLKRWWIFPLWRLTFFFFIPFPTNLTCRAISQRCCCFRVLHRSVVVLLSNPNWFLLSNCKYLLYFCCLKASIAFVCIMTAIQNIWNYASHIRGYH